MVQVQCINIVWECGVHIQNIADDQWSSLMTTGNAGGEGPRQFELVDGTRINLLESAISLIEIIFSWAFPLPIQGLGCSLSMGISKN